MKKVLVYDVEAEKLDAIEAETGNTIPQIIEAIFDLLEYEFSDSETIIKELKQYM